MDGKIAEVQKLHEEIQANLTEIEAHINKIFRVYLEGLEGSQASAELYHFFMKEIDQICEQKENDVSYLDFVFSLQLTKDKKTFTAQAKSLQKYMKQAYNRAVERVKSGEPVIEERAQTNMRRMISNKMLESISKRPENYIFPNDKTANSLEKLVINGAQYSLGEERHGAAKEVNTYISFNFDEAAKETDLSEFTLTFSEFDKQVQESVVSLMKAGNTVITPAMIHKTLTGNASDVRITPNWEEDINRSMRKFNSVFVTADLSETAKLYPGLKDVERMVKGTRLMQYEKTYVKTKNGAEVMAYSMYSTPILYTIAEAKKQVGCFEIKRLENIKTTNSIDNTELKIYLLKRINAMEHGTSTSILFETLYNALGRISKKEKETTRANTEKLLLQFVADNIIADFKIENSGRSLHKIIITLNNEIHPSGKPKNEN